MAPSRGECGHVESLLRRAPGDDGAERGNTVVVTSLDHVDDEEQADPDDVDEVPVVRGDDRARGLRVAEALGREAAADDEEEGDEAAGDVQAVEAGRQV